MSEPQEVSWVVPQKRCRGHRTELQDFYCRGLSRSGLGEGGPRGPPRHRRCCASWCDAGTVAARVWDMNARRDLRVTALLPPARLPDHGKRFLSTAGSESPPGAAGPDSGRLRPARLAHSHCCRGPGPRGVWAGAGGRGARTSGQGAAPLSAPEPPRWDPEGAALRHRPRPPGARAHPR